MSVEAACQVQQTRVGECIAFHGGGGREVSVDDTGSILGGFHVGSLLFFGGEH